MWSVKDITNYCRQLAYKMNIEFTCPVKINGRLTRTYGQVIITSGIKDKWYPEVMEISRQLLETATDESIMEVIAHEFAHWYICETTNEDHGHDALFKEVCNKIGCGFNTPTAKVERIVEDAAVYKYEVVCPNHGTISRYHRAGKVVKNIKFYACPHCGGELELKQNW